MGRVMFACLLGVGVPAAPSGEPLLERFEFHQTEMAVPMKIVLYIRDSATATRAAQAAYQRIHVLNAVMSDYDEESELRRLCDTSGEGHSVPVSDDLWKVLVHAQAIAEQSDGAFDVTVGPVVRLWRRARRQKELPAPEKLDAARKLVSYKLVRLDARKHSVELLKRGMRLDLGGIAKGYAAEEAMKVLRREGVPRAMVQAGGDICLGDPPPERPGWRLGQPSLGSPEGRPTSYLVLSNVSVSTSGDDIQFVEIGGKRYSHIVDPRTGVGMTDHCRVTVVARDGLVAEGLSKAVSVLGPEKGLPLVDKTPGAAAVVLRAPQGRIERHESRQWKEVKVVEVEP